jgi:hypothetical protein
VSDPLEKFLSSSKCAACDVLIAGKTQDPKVCTFELGVLCWRCAQKRFSYRIVMRNGFACRV